MNSAHAKLNDSLSVSLDIADFRHITFENIPVTIYKNEGKVLLADVTKSASFLVRSFDTKHLVKQIDFEWRHMGKPSIKDATHESSKEGDDAILRIGLMISGKPPLIPFFASSWIKAVKDTLKLPSDEMLYLIPSAVHKQGEQWNSPYSDSIKCLSVPSVLQSNGWQKSTINLKNPLEVVGIWIMADGDNTKSNFTVWLQNLNLR